MQDGETTQSESDTEILQTPADGIPEPHNDAPHEEPSVYAKRRFRAVVIIAVIALAGIALITYQLLLKEKPPEEPGSTYLGPSNEQKTPTAPLRFTISPTTKWKDYRGKIYPYTFAYPDTLSLVVFTNDPTDSVAISWGNIPAQLNVLIHVDDVSKNQTMQQYLGKPREYVNNWWRQYSGLQGVASVSEFTNANGLRGYRAKYLNNAGETPNDNVFFAVSNRQNLMVMFANGVLDPSVFDRILDSFDWKETAPTATPAFLPPSPTPLP